MESMKIMDACRFLGISRAAVYIAVKKGRLKAEKKDGRYSFYLKDLEAYKETKYTRKFMKDKDGNFLYSDQFLSITESAILLGLPEQRIYYLTRTNRIPHNKYGCHAIISKKALEDYRKNFLDK